MHTHLRTLPFSWRVPVLALFVIVSTLSGIHAFAQSADAAPFEPKINITTTVQGSTELNLIPFTVEFDEAVSGFDASDIRVSSGVVSSFSSVFSYIDQIGHGNSTGAPVIAGRDYYLLRDPYSVAINGSDYVYVVDNARHQVIVYAPDGTYAGNRPTSTSTSDAEIADPAGRVGNQYPNKGQENHRFTNPRDVAISPTTGLIYVVDAGNNRVMVFNPDHTYNTKITGVGGDNFVGVKGIAINNATGFIYISDHDRRAKIHKVEVFYPNNTHAETIGGALDNAQKIFYPSFMAINSTGHVFISSSSEVRVLNPDHTYAYTLGEGSTTAPGDLNGPKSIHIDKMDQIYIADSGNHRVSVFAPDGTFLYMFGSRGEDNGQFTLPYGIAINSKGHIYVADAGQSGDKTHRVSIFRTSPNNYTFDVLNPASGQLVVSIPPGAVQHPDTQSSNINTGVARIDVIPPVPPVISGVYNNSAILHTVGDSYQASFPTCTDNVDGNIAFIDTNTQPAPLNANTPLGTYQTTYSCTDTAGNTAKMINTIYVVRESSDDASDVVSPQFTPEIISNVRVGLYDTYVDVPPTCADAVAGDLYVHSTDAIVDTTMVNKHKITYSCVDPSGNKAEATRFVIVQDATASNDVTPPVLTLQGKYTEDDPYQMRYGTTYVEPGYECTDNADPKPVVRITGTDGAGVDVFGIVYECYDWNDGVHSLTRYINVTHVPPPTITTLGPQSLTLPQQDNVYFTPPAYGVQCMDNQLDRIFFPSTDSVTTIDLSSTGVHTIKYDCTDFNDRTASATQTIRVLPAVQGGDNTPPVIRLSSPVPSTTNDRDAVTFTARVSDANGIGNIVWYDGAQIIHTDRVNNSTNQTLTRTFSTTFEPGAHFITAIVYDGSQQRNVGISPQIIEFDVVKFDESLLLPIVSITPGSPVSEGDVATATITVEPPLQMVIQYEISEKGSYLAGAGARPAGIYTTETDSDGTRTISIRTLDDLADEPDGAIAFGILDGKACDECGNYTVSEPKSVAHTLVRDNDNPSAVTVRLTTTESDPTNNTRIPFVANFTKPVHGLTASDIATSSGTVANFSTADPGLFASYIGRIGVGYGTTDNYHFNYPLGITMDQNDHLYVVDTTNLRIQMYGPDGKHVDTISNTLSNGTVVFGNPLGIALNGTGYIHIADKINGTVIFAPDGTYVGGIPATDGHFADVAINDTGHMYVTNVIAGTNTEQVRVYSPDGTLLHSFGVRETAEGIAINSTGYIYVSTSRSEDSVDIYAPNYTKVGEINLRTNTGSTYIHIDENDRVYISEKRAGKVQVYDSDGKTHLYTVGSKGSKPGQLSNPSGITMNSKGHLYVMSQANHYANIYEIKESGKAHTFDVLNPAGGLLTVSVPPGAVHDISYSSNVNPGVTSITVDSTNVLPDRPTGLRAVAGDGRVTLTWNEPTNTGSHSITDYIVEFNPAGPQDWTPYRDDVRSVTGATVTNLQNGVEYAFRVAATTGAGNSPWSDTATATPRSTSPPPPPPPRAPDAPTGLQANAGDTQVSLSWNIPSSGGAAISSYTIEYRAGSTVQWTEQTSSTNSYTVTNLANGQLYEFRVHATNTAGNSPWSDTATATPRSTAPPPPPPPQAPDAPTGLQTDADDAQVSLTWSEPSNNGATIDSYTIEYRAGSTGSWIPKTSSTNSYTVTNLANGQLYEFRVHATNTAGNSPWSDTATATPRSTAPPPPSDTTPPKFTSPDAVEFTELVPSTHTIAVTDESTVTFVLESHNVTGTPLPTVSTTGQLEWIPSEAQGIGNPNTIYSVTINATDSHGNSALHDIHIAVSESNIPPTLTPIQAQNTISGQTITIALEATDSDVPANTLTYEHNHTSGTITRSGSQTASFAWTPATSDVGTHYVNFTVSDNMGGTDSQVVIFMISDAIIPDTDPPEFTSTDMLTFAELVSSTHTVVATDSSAVTFALTSHNVTGAPVPTISATVGLLEWTPSEAQGIGNPNTIYSVTINATDSHGNSALHDIHITVSESNTPPVFTPIQAQQNTVSGQPITIALEATDSDVPANTLTYEHNHTSGIITPTDSRTASFAWTPATSDVGTHYVNFTVSDNMGGADSQVVVFTISDAMNQGTTDMQSSAPDAPTNLMVVAVGNGYATLSWSVPSNDGGSPITDYIVQYSSDAGSNWHTFNGMVSSTSANVTGLVNGQAYQFRVSAVNSQSPSDHSNVSAPVRPAAGDPEDTDPPVDAGDDTDVNPDHPPNNEPPAPKICR